MLSIELPAIQTLPSNTIQKTYITNLASCIYIFFSRTQSTPHQKMQAQKVILKS
jgi:hypothetical protein